MNTEYLVEQISYEDLSCAEKENVSEDGFGSKYASYLRIKFKGEIINLYSDAMEGKNAMFGRDLSWIAVELERAYKLGRGA